MAKLSAPFPFACKDGSMLERMYVSEVGSVISERGSAGSWSVAECELSTVGGGSDGPGSGGLVNEQLDNAIASARLQRKVRLRIFVMLKLVRSFQDETAQRLLGVDSASFGAAQTQDLHHR
jgi:hypothetical protein